MFCTEHSRVPAIVLIGIWSKGLSQKVYKSIGPKSRGLQVKRSPNQKGYKSKGPRQKVYKNLNKGIVQTFIIYIFIVICDI